MGQPEQFAKDTFAEEIEPSTRGALAWKDPPEIRLLKVQADGMLLVRDPARLPELAPPWSAAAGHDEILLELKMAGDHTHLSAIERILLRRQARQVERLEDDKAPWVGIEPVWVAGSHVPDILRRFYKVHRFAPGCYHVGPAVFSFVWIASNELPLRDDLVPFLLTRSGKALDEFGLWAAMRRAPGWLLRMLQSTAMSNAVRKQVELYMEPDSPEMRERQRHLAKMLLRLDPELKREILSEGRSEALSEGCLVEARSALRRVLARRGLVVRPKDDARVDACTDLALLERWHDDAVVAKTAAEVFVEPAKKQRATSKHRAR
jgi:hypothetical protein